MVERLPDRVHAALNGDREALIGLLVTAGDAAWQSRAAVAGTVEEVAGASHRFADEVADCYSMDRPPSDQMCDDGFALADRVEALVAEVLHLRARAGITGDEALPQPLRSPTREVRHQARAHLAALRDAARAEHVVTDCDVQAAAHLYRAIVTVHRERLGQDARAALKHGLGPRPGGPMGTGDLGPA